MQTMKQPKNFPKTDMNLFLNLKTRQKENVLLPKGKIKWQLPG